MATRYAVLSDAVRVTQRYVCSDCWEHLIVIDLKTEGLEVRCTTKDCPCNGLVSKGHADRKEAESAAELAEAKYALRKAGVLPKPTQSAADLLKALGY